MAALLASASSTAAQVMTPATSGASGCYWQYLALTEKARLRDRKASRKRGRPRVGGRTRRVLVASEASLLRRSDAYAEKHDLTRSALIARGLKELLGKNAESTRPK